MSVLKSAVIGMGLVFGLASTAFPQCMPLPQLIGGIQESNPQDTQYVIVGDHFQDFVKLSTAMSDKGPIPEMFLAQTDMALVTDGPGAPGGAGVFLLKRKDGATICIMGSYLVTSGNFQETLTKSEAVAAAVPMLPKPMVTPQMAPKPVPPMYRGVRSI